MNNIFSLRLMQALNCWNYVRYMRKAKKWRSDQLKILKFTQFKDIINDPIFKKEEIHKFIDKLNTESLEALLAQEAQRAKTIDEKLQKLTTVLPIALTVSLFVINYVLSETSFTIWSIVGLVFLVLSTASIFFGAIFGFQGILPKAKAGIGAEYLSIIAKPGNEADDEMKWAASHYHVSIAIQVIYTHVAINLIRIGVILFTIGVALTVFDKFGGDYKEPRHECKNSECFRLCQQDEIVTCPR